MIHQVLIVSKAGLCIYSYDFSNMDIDPQLVAGFTTAINTFSETLITKQQNIESLLMSTLNLRISSFLHDMLLMVVFYNKYDNVDIIDSIIFDLETQFIERYGHIDMLTVDDINVFRPFDEIVNPLCKTFINIGLLSFQTEYKLRIWNEIGKFTKEQQNPPLASGEIANHQTSLNILEYFDPDLPSCDISIWNIDLEILESNLHIYQNKQLFLIFIEPNFKSILQIIPKLEILKENFPQSHIVGIILENYGKITKVNCEKLLQIPLCEVNLADSPLSDHFQHVIKEIVSGSS